MLLPRRTIPKSCSAPFCLSLEHPGPQPCSVAMGNITGGGGTCRHGSVPVKSVGLG